MANVIHSTLTYNANLSPAQAQIKALTGQIATLTAAFNALDKSAMKTQAQLATSFMAGAGQIGGFTTQMVKTNTAVDNFGQAIAKNRLTMRQYFREAFAGYAKQNSMMKQLARQQVMMQQSMLVPMGAGVGGAGRAALITPTSLDALASKSALAAKKFSIFNELIDGGSTRLLNFGKNTQWTGRQLMVGFTLPLIMFTALVSKQFREIDKELTRFEKVYGADLADSVEGSTKKMREQVEQLAYSISSAYGIAAKDTAALAADIAQTGKEGQALLDSIRQTTRLSVLGEVERQEAMQATLSIQNAFKLNTNELAESIDFLNAVENQTSTNLQDLAGAIPRVGPVIQSLNGDIKDMSLLLVAMREGGVAAGEAANALKSGLGRLINPTRQAREAAASFGISLEDIIQNSRGELIPMIFALQDALGGLDDFARAQVIEKLFGKYQFARMSALFTNLRRQGSQTLQVMELASASSTELAKIANEELATLQQSTAMRFQRTVESLKNSLLPLGELLTESMIPILSGIGNAIRSFMDFFSALPGPIKDFTKFAVVVTALAGPVVMLVGLFGNLAANGIKFLLGLTKIGAKLMGMKVDKFEFLTRDVMAAQLGVDGLTTSFMEQDVALRKLSGSLMTYSTQLRQALALNPAFAVAGAPMPGRGPIRRQAGSRGAEFVPGSGRGDKIPAMLEPGEFVVNRAATEKFAPILVAMNKGNVQGFAKGTQETHLTGSRMVPASTLVATQGLAKAVESNLRLLGNQLIQVFSNLVVSLPTKINQDLRVGQPGVPASVISTLLKDQQTWSNIMKNTGLTFQELQPVIKSVTSGLDRLDNEIINDPKLYQMVEASLATLSTQGDRAAKVLQVLSSQYGTFDLKRGQIDDILRQGGSPVIKETGQRERLGVGVAPSYTTPLSGRGQLLQNKPYMDLGSGVRVAPGSEIVAKEIANVQQQELGWAKRRVQAASSIEKYMKMREKLLINITNSENQEANIRAELTRITRDSKIPLEEKLRLQKSLNAQILAERAERERMAGIVKRIDTDIANAKQRELNALKSGIGRGPGGSYGYLSGGASPYAGAAPVGGAPLWLRERMREANANRPKTLIRGQSIGPDRDGMQMAGPRGQGMMNAAFMSTMLISSFSMMGGASNDLAIKLGLLSTAVMTATMAMQMFAGKNVAGNFLGLGSLGKKVSAAGAARNAAANAAMLPGQALIAGPKLPVGAPAGGMMPMTAAKGAAGAGLLRMGGMLSMLGGPVGMAAAAVAVAGVTGFIMYQKAAEEARERAMSAFADPAKTAEYFGLAVEDVTEKLKAVSSAVPGIEEVDQNLREAVKGDYAVLIEKLRFSGAEAGGRELGIVFNKMLASGLSKEQAQEAVKAIAIESGAAGGAAYADAMRQGMFADKDAAQIAQSTADMFNPEKQARNRAQAQQTLTQFEGQVGFLGRIQGTMAQNFDNTFGDVLTGAQSFASNLNPVMQGIRAVTDFDMFERMFDKDASQEFIDNAANTERQVHQMQTNIEEMADVSADSIVKITEIMFENFKKAPRETIDAFREIQEAGQKATAVPFDPQPIKDFISEIDPINGIILNALIGQDEEIGMKVMEAIAAGMSVQEIIDSLTTGGVPSLEVEVELKVREQELQVQLDEMKADLKEDLVVDLDLQIEEEEKQLESVNKQLDRMDKFRARHEGVLKKEMSRLNRASQSAIDGMKDEIDLIRERADARKEEYDERIEDLNEEKDLINKSTDAYIDSLRKRERADSFYSNQRKTAFSALQKLASGDVFGFLQEREQMSADAQTFAYDNMIQGIEDKRDREIESIEETIDKEQERQEKYEKNVEDRIELIQDQIDSEEELMDERQKNFDREMRFFDRKEKRRREDLENEKREVQVSLDQLRATRQAAESGQIQSQKELSKALGEEKAKPYFEEQKAIVKTEMMKKYIEMRDKYPDETEAESQMRAHGELIDLFNALYGVTPGQGRRPTMGWAQQLEDIGFTTNFNTGGAVKGPGTPTSDSIPAMLSNGEYVVRASSVNKYGKEMMDTINAGKFANGGLVGNVQKFEEGGEVKTPVTRRGASPRYRNAGPNGWPYGSSNLATGKIPGTSSSLTLNKTVLPLFLSLASEYNKKIRKINPSQTGGYREGGYPSNHPSGTAIDINWSEEGGLEEMSAPGDVGNSLYNWWKLGKRDARAPWQALSAAPYRVVNELMRKYKVIQWFGPESLGGYIKSSFQPNSPGVPGYDYMHFQISQSRSVSPEDVQDVIKELGIENDGSGVEGGNSGGGVPGREKRPKKGSNGTSVKGRYIPSSSFGSGNTQFGKASPRFVTGINLPGKDSSGGGNGNDNNGGKPGNDGGPKYESQYIKGARLVKLLDSVGFKGPDLRTAYGVVMGESGGNRKAVNDNGTNKDWGLFQMNDYWNRNIMVDGKKADFSPSKIFDAEYNSRFARATTKDPGVISYWKDPWKDWNAYNNNTEWYRKGLEEFDKNPQWRKALNLNAGGFIAGPGTPVSDSIPAMLSNGEYVINADSVRKYGKIFLDKINSGQFAETSYGLPEPELKMRMGGFVGKAKRRNISSPMFNLPSASGLSSRNIANTVNNSQASNSSAVNNSNNVKIVINGAGKNANAIANKVAKMINASNDARNHSRSIN